MADYNPILDPEIAPDSPAPSILFHRLRDNPAAIAEGAAGAPRVTAKALETGFVGGGNGAGQTAFGFNDLEYALSIKLASSYFKGTGSQGCVQISFSSDGGVSWGGWQNLTNNTTNASVVMSAESHINLQTGSRFAINSGAADDGFLSNSLTMPAGRVDSIRFRGSQAGTSTTAVMLYVTGGRDDV